MAVKTTPVYVNPIADTAAGITGVTSYIIDSPLDGQFVLSDGGDTDNLILIGGNNSQFIDQNGGTSADHIVLTGIGDTVSAAGTNMVDVYGLDAKINFIAVPGVNGGDNTVNVLGTANPVITGGGSNLTVIGAGSGIIETNPGTASKTYQNGGTNSVLFRGGDTATTDGHHIGTNIMVAGNGPSTLIGSDYGYNYLQARGNAGDFLSTGEYANSEMTAVGSTKDNHLTGFLGSWVPSTDAGSNKNSPNPYTIMRAGAGNDTLTGGAGTTIMYAGTGADTFEFDYSRQNQVGSLNHALIYGFKVGVDHLRISGDPDADLFAPPSTKNGQGGTVLQLSDGTSIMFSSTAITANDIIRV